MSKGRYQNNKTTGKKWILLLMLVVILAALIVFAVFGGAGDNTAQPDETLNTQETNSPATEEVVPETDAATEAQTQATDAPAVTDSVPEETKAPEAATEAPEETTAPTSAPVQAPETPEIQIIQRADAEYEKWLAATMVVCVSMEYPDFELNGIYAASSTALENAMDSKGAYILFTSGSQQLAIHSKPLAAERTEAGTKDISSETLGFATYDLVSAASVNTASLTEIKVEDLSELISQSMLVSIYEH